MMERYFWAALQLVPGLGNARLKNLVASFGSAEQVWQAHRRDLFLRDFLSPAVCNNLLAHREKIDIDKFSVSCLKKGISLTCLADDDYPPLLAKTFDPPVVLYYRGRLPAGQPLIAVVGARRASAYGLNAATMLASQFVLAGLGVVSGAARGIDTAAHRGALQQTGYTLAVLGCGVDIPYPQENAKILASIAEHGAIVSEYAPGTPPHAKFFPVRNRIIAGLSRGVVVVEAADRSGSLITADFALEEGRDVFAVPGSIFSAVSRGTNRLIKQGAKPVESAADVLEEYGLAQPAPSVSRPPALSAGQSAVIGVLSTDSAVGMEEILATTGMTPQEVVPILVQLELQGLITQYSGQRYVRVPKEGNC
jgi:DNA processing protein